MREKRSAFFTILVIASILLIFTGADLIQEDRNFSETENKILAKRPKLTAKSLFLENYTEDYETYLTEQFVGRDKWITVKTYMDIFLQKKEIKGVYLGADDYLIEQHLPEDYAALEQEKVQLLARLAEKWDVTVMIAPTADNIIRDKLPAYAPVYDEAALLDRVAEQVGAENCVDVYAALQEHAGEEIYYRTDHHWTSLGAYYAYLAWAEAVGQEPEPYRPADMEVVTEEFLGTLHSKVNLDVRPDRILYFPKTADRVLSVTYDQKTVAESCYERSYLDTKNKYGFFLDDNHPFIEIETDSANGKTLFVLKDSYANCLIPLLMSHYEKIYVMDLRYFNGKLFPFMEDYEPEGGMDVLVLYNAIHFLEAFRYN